MRSWQRPIATLALACAASLPLGCSVPATTGSGSIGSASPPPLPSPARIGLPRIYRPFVDALEASGDWVLIEPYGWLFRPRVNTVAWRPYREGYWEASDVYGWIWNSQDEFGWITDHYGSWFYDRFQGWVWQPGAVWGPAWVAWVASDDQIGWAPLAPEEYRGWDEVPGGAFLFASAQQFDLSGGAMGAMFARELPVVKGQLEPVGAEVVVEGKRLILGPSLERIRQMGGMARPRDEALPRKLPLDSNAQVPALDARVRAALQAAKREWSAARAASDPSPPADSAPAAPRVKDAIGPRVKPLGRPQPADSTEVDSSTRRVKPGRPTPASADTTRR